MKPFNLELALQGHPVITRSGVEVKQLILWDIEGEFPLNANVNGVIEHYTIHGTFGMFDSFEYPEDLFMADHEPLTYKKLKSLEQSNSERIDFLNSLYSNSPQPNGIACPNCGQELLDTNSMMTLTSNPPKKSIHCSKCNFNGYRIA